MAPRIRTYVWVLGLAVAGILTTEAGQARAQTLEEGWSKLDAKHKTVHLRARGLLNGTERFDPNDPSQIEAVDVQAKYYTYGVYLRKLDSEAGAIKRDFDAFEKDVDVIEKNNLQSVGEVLRDKVRIHALEVLQFKNAQPIHKVHNARVLVKIAKLGQPLLADTLVKVLNDSQQNDGVRYYVFQAMGTLLPQVQPPEQTKCAEAIAAFLKERKGPDKNAPKGEFEGFRSLRREAIRALAKIHTPAFNDKVRPALVLARFAGNDESIQPPPRIDERVEAALGLARMQPGKDNRYQPDYAAGQIAKCLGSFSLAFVAERQGEKPDEKKEIWTHPWRVEAARLKDALEAMKKNIVKNDYVAQIANRGVPLVGKVMTLATIDPNEISWWRSTQSDPPSKELFQGSPDSVVKPAQVNEDSAEK